jgi:hypothetical protein
MRRRWSAVWECADVIVLAVAAVLVRPLLASAEAPRWLQQMFGEDEAPTRRNEEK